LCSGETLDIDKYEELSESQRKALSALLDNHAEDSQRDLPAHLDAAHLLVSAMEGEAELWTEYGKTIFCKTR